MLSVATEKKSPVTPPEIYPETVRLIGQCHGDYRSKFIYDRKKSVSAIGLIITRFTLRQRAVRKPYTEINSNPIHGLITDTRLQKDGRGFHTTRFIFFASFKDAW